MRALFFLLLATFCFGETIQPAADAPQPLSPEESAARMKLPEGFRIELVASEPVIQEPSCIAFDEQGRIYVTELHGYNVEGEIDVAELNKSGELDTEVRRLRWEFMGGKVAEEAKKRQYGKLKLLKDNDGDGKMDESIVWADDLPAAYGVIPARGGVIVVAAPDIVFFADRDGDDRPDVRETLYTGFKKREMERGINNPRWGLDNWIYVGAGGHGGMITGPHLKEPVDLHHSDFRIKADGSAIEPVTGRVGTYGLAMNDVGDRFPCSGGQPAIYALPMPYKMLTRNPFAAMPSTNHSAANYGRGFRISDPHPWRVRRRQDPAWIKFYGNRETDSNYFTGGCGGQIYTADLFPEEYHGNFFYCEPSLNIIHRCVLTRDGAGYKAQRAEGEEASEFLASKDQWFRPMNLRVGPDGALYIIDMYREIIEDYSAIPRFLQQQYGLDKGRDRGRIWRLLPEDVTLKRKKQKPGSVGRSMIALGDSNMRNRLAAQQAIIDFVTNSDDPAKTKKDVGQFIRSSANVGAAVAKLHTLYALDGIGELKSLNLLRAMRDSDYRVRLHGLRLATTKERLVGSVAAAIREMADQVPADDDPSVRLQLALSTGGLDKPASHLANLAINHGDEKWMAAAILSSAESCSGELLTSIIQSEVNKKKSESLLEPLAAAIAARRDRVSIRELLAILPEANEATRKPCLLGLAEGLARGSEPVPFLSESESEDYVQEILAKSRKDKSVVHPATRVAARLFDPNSASGKWLFNAMAKAAVRESSSLESREFAISVLDVAPFSIVSSVAPKILDGRQAPVLQRALVDSLNACDEEQVVELMVRKWQGYSPDIRRHVVNALFSRADRLPKLLEVLERGDSLRPSDVTEEQGARLINHEKPEIAKRASELLQATRSAGNLSERINEYKSALTGTRDSQRGRKVFEKTCLNCHKLGAEGHEVGPPLGSMLNKPDEAILVDILDPSAKIDSEYANYTVVNSSGQSFAGVLASESPTSVTLKMEKGVTKEILRNDIDEMKASEVSLMPSNLHEQIGPQAMSDLLSYMREAFAAHSIAE